MSAFSGISFHNNFSRSMWMRSFYPLSRLTRLRHGLTLSLVALAVDRGDGGSGADQGSPPFPSHPHSLDLSGIGMLLEGQLFHVVLSSGRR